MRPRGGAAGAAVASLWAVAACTFPDVGISPSGAGGEGAQTSTGVDTSATGSVTSSTAGGGTSSSSSQGGEGGAPSSTGSVGGQGGEGGGDQGGGGGDQGGGGQGAGGQGGGGPCPEGCDCESCPPDAKVGDCDGDDDPDGEDCHRCNALVHHEQGAFFADPYEELDGVGTSYDYNCDDALDMDETYTADQCTDFSLLTCPAAVYYSIAPACGGSASRQNCSNNLACTVGSTQGVTIKCQ